MSVGVGCRRFSEWLGIRKSGWGKTGGAAAASAIPELESFVDLGYGLGEALKTNDRAIND